MTEELNRAIESIRQELGKVVVGQDRVLEEMMVGLLAEGHVLLEGVPGLAKTLMVRALARVLSVDFRRIQFTPDLMPSDIIGTNVYELQAGNFRVKKGPIFTNLLLADEVNRTPPKTQAALLEAMEERQVTIDGVAYPLPAPFIVFATQNPVEYEGTYPLPEAQLDRFMLKIVVDYPAPDEEVRLLDNHRQGFRSGELDRAGLQPVADAGTILRGRESVRRVLVERPILEYIAAIARTTRDWPSLSLGASPRAALTLLSASQALAAIRGRDFVTPDDVKAMALPVLRHRLVLRPEAEVEGTRPDHVITRILETIPVPR